MNDMPSVTTIRPNESKAPPVRSLLLWGGLAVVIAIVAVIASSALRGPSFVPSVTITNPSPYVMEVDVTATNADEWTQIATIPPKGTSGSEQVVDQGKSWTFRARSAGVDGGEFTLSRSDLERADWKVTIPPAVTAKLRAQNVPEAPPAGY